MAGRDAGRHHNVVAASLRARQLHLREGELVINEIFLKLENQIPDFTIQLIETATLTRTERRSDMSQVGRWPRIREILDGSLERWAAEHGREPKMKAVHEGHIGWETKEELAESTVFGLQLIEPEMVGNGRAEETNLIKILRRNIGGYRRMPSRGPYIPEDEIREIVDWINAGMPEQEAAPGFISEDARATAHPEVSMAQ